MSGGVRAGFREREGARAGDEAAVRRMASATGFFREDEVEVACELVRERLEKGPASGYEFVFAEGEDGSPIGYACFGPIACTLGSYDLYWIVVEPGRQGRGVGRALVDAVERRVREAGGRGVYIETSSTARYEPTRRFYERCGYRLEARLEDFYSDGDDKLVFGKRFRGGTPASRRA